jgi:hypothetical protein
MSNPSLSRSYRPSGVRIAHPFSHSALHAVSQLTIIDTTDVLDNVP